MSAHSRMKTWLRIGIALVAGVPLVLIGAWEILLWWVHSRPYEPAQNGPPEIWAEPPPEVRAALGHTDTFQSFRRVSSIPRFVRDSLASETRDSQVLMAEPNGPWEVGDAISDLALPRLRLLSVALSPDYCFLFYEGGGLVHYFVVSVSRVYTHALVWRAYTGSVTDLVDLQRALILFDKLSPPHALLQRVSNVTSPTVRK
jgi:hypothetical protein